MSSAEPPLSGPVLIELEEDSPQPDPADAPLVPDAPHPAPTAMQQIASLASRRPSRLTALFWSALTALVGIVLSVAIWDFTAALLARSPYLGWVVTGLAASLGVCVAAFVVREIASLFRLSRLDQIQKSVEAARTEGDLSAARDAVDKCVALYASRPETEWGRRRLADRQGEILDASGLLSLAEVEVLTPLDSAAQREIEAAARQVATVTALVPLALADVIAALIANLRMIRRISEIYGGRAGTIGAWRLTRSVLTHLVATGALAAGDDLLQSVAGGSLLSRLSRRFGEGMVNGALTARVGLAALEVCRPMPFVAAERPTVTGLVTRALAGLITGSGARSEDETAPKP